ncbi:hypothetical protein XENTR_v10013422 [Xenopus tropicalis]|uniref:Thrombomodulin n=1 Tax=Xenopus tropicalis TaxID=8364 RepID=A0A6I8PZF2_XENTR|nr:thrombomodulin [Xenopus tropicalis]KAE8600837.1 hypothetical protein XENTR_v10013422 [Xenopus tropicalis]|eukprot:XP_002936963.2 PREDICTED: thrombomodulin [Xenopus tropicalis]
MMRRLLQTVLWVLLSAQLGILSLADQNLPNFTCIGQSCYVGFWNSKRYNKAERKCRELGGHLMAVRSSVEAEVVEMLMGESGDKVARVWIGLELRGQCTDISLPLRGFQWVTGESDTNYSNWKSNERKCGDQCVVVHKDLSWEEALCDSKTDGNLCEIPYSTSCQPMNFPQGLDVTYETPLGMAGPGITFLPPDTKAVIPSAHLSLVCKDQGDGEMKWTSEDDGAWNCMIENGGCSFICNGDTEGSRCECGPNTILSDDGRSCIPLPSSLQCNPDQPNGTCVCAEGFTSSEDGRTCQDIDDCALIPNPCDQVCTNTDGSFICTCLPGFVMADGQCKDIIECDNETICEQKCENFPGGFSCVCGKGYIIDEKNPRRCKPICNTTICPAFCHNGCSCPEGYVLDTEEELKPVCRDIDECENGFCKDLCKNLPGSYACYSDEGITTTPIPPFKPTSPRDDHSVQQPIIAFGICVGILSILIVLIAIICHLVRKHHMDQAALDYKNPEKGVVLQQVKTTSSMKL